jgi:exosortase/archaeosortase family protein
MRSKITIFLVKICILFFIWLLCEELLLTTRFWQALNSVVLREVLFFSKQSLIILGSILDFTIQSIPSNGIKGAPHDTLIFFSGEISYQNYKEIFISNRCLAIDLMYTYSVFIIAFYGPWKKKLWYIPLGIVIINFMNVLRIIGLVITCLYFPKYLDLNHHLIFAYAVYFFTFIMWVIWIRKYAKDDLIKMVEEMKTKDLASSK